MVISLHTLPNEILLYIVRLGNDAPAISHVDRRLRKIAITCFEELNNKMGLLPISLHEKVLTGPLPIVILKQALYHLHNMALRYDIKSPFNLPFERLQWSLDIFWKFKLTISECQKKKAKQEILARMEEAQKMHDRLCSAGPFTLNHVDYNKTG